MAQYPFGSVAGRQGPHIPEDEMSVGALDEDSKSMKSGRFDVDAMVRQHGASFEGKDTRPIAKCFRARHDAG
jgi:hypothetical protein